MHHLYIICFVHIITQIIHQSTLPANSRFWVMLTILTSSHVHQLFSLFCIEGTPFNLLLTGMYH